MLVVFMCNKNMRWFFSLICKSAVQPIDAAVHRRNYSWTHWCTS